MENIKREKDEKVKKMYEIMVSDKTQEEKQKLVKIAMREYKWCLSKGWEYSESYFRGVDMILNHEYNKQRSKL